MWVQNKMSTRPETALAQRSRRCFQNFWVTTGRLNFLWSNVSLDESLSINRLEFSKKRLKKNLLYAIVAKKVFCNHSELKDSSDSVPLGVISFLTHKKGAATSVIQKNLTSV